MNTLNALLLWLLSLLSSPSTAINQCNASVSQDTACVVNAPVISKQQRPRWAPVPRQISNGL